MTLRLAKLEDIPRCVELVSHFHQVSPFSHMVFDGEGLHNTLAHFISDPNQFLVLLLLHEDLPVGLLVACLQPLLGGCQNVATELYWWVEPEFRGRVKSERLIDAFEYWARKVGAHTTVLSSLHGDLHKPLARYYTRRGYRPVEYTFMKEV